MSPPNGYGMVAKCKIADRAHCDAPIYRQGLCLEHFNWSCGRRPDGSTFLVSAQEERDRWAAHDREVLARQKAEFAKRWKVKP